MRFFLRTLFGFGLMVAAVVAIPYAVYQLLQIGTCASGGPYVPARVCPPGTERIGLSIFVSVIAMIFGAWLYRGRGRTPDTRSERNGVPAMALIFAGVFLGVAFACLWGIWGPDANPGPGAKLGGLIVAFVFLPIGLIGGIAFYRQGRARPIALRTPLTLSEGFRTSGGMAPATSVGGEGDPVERLERLQRLRAEGAVTAEEFESLKRRVLEEGEG